MIVSKLNKGNVTVGLVDGKQVLNYERREPKRKEGKGADQTNSRFKRRETMMAAT